MTTYTQGQRVTTPHGAGTVVGFEQFARDGMSLPPSAVDTGDDCRVLVQLDNPSNWLGSKVSSLPPHYSRSDLI